MGRTEAVCWVGIKLEAIITFSWAGGEEKKKNRKKDLRNIPEVDKESDVIESKEETIVRKEIC